MDTNSTNIVVQNLHRKKALLEAGNPAHAEIRPLLLVLGGGNACVYSAATLYALQAMGLSNAFMAIVGISGGAWSCAYFAAGFESIRRGLSAFYCEFTTSKFINWTRFPRILSKDAILELVTCGRIPLDLHAVRNFGPEFFVGVTALNGEGKFISAKSNDLLSALLATSATLLAYEHPISVSGDHYFDGGIAMPFPIAETIERFQPTDILVLPSAAQTRASSMPIKERVLIEALFRHNASRLPQCLKPIVLSRYAGFWKGVEFAKSQPNVFIHWPPDLGIDSITTDSKRLRWAAFKTAEETLSTFGRQDIKIELY